MTTSAGAVVGLMGSDEQFKLPEFPVVLAYNRVNHFLPTAPLSDDSLLNWHMSVIQQCLDGGYEFFLESQPKMYKEPELNEKLTKLFSDYVDLKHMLKDRAKLGTTAATSTPMYLTGRKPKRSDTIGRWGDIPSKSQKLIDLDQPFFENELDNPALPLYRRKEIEEQEKLKSSNKPATSTHQTVTVTVQETSQPTTTSFMPTSNVTSTGKKSIVVSLPLSSSTTQKSCPPKKRQKRQAVKKSIVETDTIDDEDVDITYVPDEEEEEEEDDDGDGEEEQQEKGTTSSSSSIPHHLSSQATSLRTGIPKLPAKRKAADESKKKYTCNVCSQKFSRSSELRDHTYTKHLGCSYDCTDCLKTYATKKALKYHNDTIHGGKAGVQCNEEGCSWEAKDVGKLHDHLLTVHGIGEPIVCQVIEAGKKCNKVFKNTRSFQAHASFHMEKKIKCEICDRYFSTQEKIRAHVRKYHRSVDDENKYQCEICGNILETENQYNHHKRLHMMQHHEMLKQLGEKPQQKATKTVRGSAPSTDTDKDTPAPPPPPPPSETEEIQEVSSTPPGTKTAEQDLKLIGHVTVITKKEDPDLEATLDQIAQEEEAAAKTKEEEKQED